MSGPLIELDGVWQEFRPRTAHGTRRRGAAPTWALSNVSFSIDRSERVGIVGHNGSGKTTLLRTLAGVLEPSRGSCAVKGEVSSLLDLTAGLNRDLSGTENILLGGVLLGMTRRQVRDEYGNICSFSGLDQEVLGQPLSAYSAGMTLRIAFSVLTRRLASVLLVDEVLAVGDEDFQQRALEWIGDFTSQGVVIMASHDLDLVRKFCSRLLVFESGRLVFDGSPDKALEVYAGLPPTEAAPIESPSAWMERSSRMKRRRWSLPFTPTGARRAQK